MDIRHFLYPISNLFIPVMLTLLQLQSNGYSQATAPPSTQRDSLIEVRNDLLDKSQNQKILAWVMMGVGVPVVVLGLLAGAIGGNPVPGLIGLGTVIGSITLFSAASKNQTRALKMDIGFIPHLSPPGKNQYGDSSHSLNSLKVFPGIQLAYTF